MSNLPTNLPNTPFRDLALELRLFVGRDFKFTQDFEEYIARLPAEHDRTSLTLSLDGCRRSTERLAELYRIISAFSAHETEIRALHAQLQAELKRGPPAAA